MNNLPGSKKNGRSSAYRWDTFCYYALLLNHVVVVVVVVVVLLLLLVGPSQGSYVPEGSCRTPHYRGGHISGKVQTSICGDRCAEVENKINGKEEGCSRPQAVSCC